MPRCTAGSRQARALTSKEYELRQARRAREAKEACARAKQKGAGGPCLGHRYVQKAHTCEKHAHLCIQKHTPLRSKAHTHNNTQPPHTQLPASTSPHTCTRRLNALHVGIHLNASTTAESAAGVAVAEAAGVTVAETLAAGVTVAET